MKKIFLQRAEENLPQIKECLIVPEHENNPLNKSDELVLDLENHYVGYFSFRLSCVDAYIDAPVKIYIKFCETAKELNDDFSSYKGSLCSSWLQEEIITLDSPGEYKLQRRYAARYIKLKVIDTPLPVRLTDFRFKSVTSADFNNLQKVDFPDEATRRLDTVSLNTLKNCMQYVFEDGPKRDRRLWIGDLRLEALANYYSFKNFELVRRCLYLLAASDRNDYGLMPGYVYDKPEYVSGTWFLEDYALLFAASVCDYYKHSKDKDTFFELYPEVKSQMDAVDLLLDSDGIVTVPKGTAVFVDWCEGLGKITSLHGVLLYTLKLIIEVLSRLEHPDVSLYEERYLKARENAFKILYSKEENVFINEKDNYQYSVHSAVWMILGEVVSGNMAKDILTTALNSPLSKKPFTPYMHHYVVEAMLKINMYEEAREYMHKYWGAMVSEGADTFYEVYVPGEPDFSPYGDRMINSMCHAWSCTPAYYIRKFFNLSL